MSVDKKAVRKSLRTNFNPGPRDHLNRVLLRGRQVLHVPGLLAGGRLDKPIFIIGAPRSGTSLLFRVLRASSRLAHWPGEAHEVWEADFHPALTGWASNALIAADAQRPEAERIKRSFYLVTGGRRRLIDKTPRNALRVPFIDALFPDARFIYLQRDGRENINSLINAWRTPRYRTYRLPEPHAIPGADPAWWKFVLYPGWQKDASGPLEVVCAKQWLTCNDAALEASRSIGLERWVEVRYEQLIEDPEQEVKRLVEFLGLPYEESVKDKAGEVKTKPVNVVTPVQAGKWRHENPQEIASVLPLIRSTMSEMGYELDEN